MTVSAQLHGAGIAAAYNKELDFGSDTIKVALVGSGHTPNALTEDYWDDVVADEITGTGYTADGATLANASCAFVVANSWAQTWVASTAYAKGALVRPTTGNTHLYMAIAAGTSAGAGSEPTWPTAAYGTVVDNGVTWMEIGRGAVKFDSDDPSWANATVTARYAYLYDDTPAADAAKPIILHVDFGEDVSSLASTFTITWAVYGILAMPVA